jgi:diaminopimelate decarboxylase
VTIRLNTQHAPLTYFDTRNDELLVAGEALSTLVKRIGRTPFYAYDHTVIDRKLSELRAVIPHDVHIHYAIKANPMREVVNYLSTRTDGLDVASGNELALALASRQSPQNISFAGPAKSEAELLAATKAGVLINVESERELHLLAQIATQTQQRPRIAIRVNPAFELKTSGMKMGGGPQPFGIDAERVPEILSLVGKLPLEFFGFHIFSGSQNLRADAIIEAQQLSVELAIELARHAPAPPQLINIGGGFGVPYFPGDSPLDLKLIGTNLSQLQRQFTQALPNARLTLELGRYLVAEAGIYVCRVIDRKLSRGQVFLITDGGLHHHLAASGNFGQVIRKNFPVLVGNRVQGDAREVVTVTGPLCTPLDILADKMDMPTAGVGDLIVVMQSGAYGLTASPTRFLGHPEPAEVFI